MSAGVLFDGVLSLWVFLIIALVYQTRKWLGKPMIEKPEAATGCVLLQKVFLEFSQNSQENGCASVSFLIKLQAEALGLCQIEALGLCQSLRPKTWV